MRAPDFRALLARAVPKRCALCGTSGVEGGLCVHCTTDLPPLPVPCCPVCAAPSPTGATCGACLKAPPRFDATFVGCSYAFPVDALIRALKYRRTLAAAGALAEVLARGLWGAPAPDLVVPVPLSAERERARGFNQSLEIARCLPARWRRAIDAAALVRTHDTPPQAALPLVDRARNVKGAFRAARTLDAMSIALVDDVMTTGATLDAAAAALKAAGARDVVAWVVARTPPPA